MLKFILILGVIFGAVLMGAYWLRRKFISFLGNFGVRPPQQQAEVQHNEPYKDVVYNRDDVVVLKGDAEKKKPK